MGSSQYCLSTPFIYHQVLSFNPSGVIFIKVKDRFFESLKEIRIIHFTFALKK